MNLRSGTVVGAHILRPEHRPAFAEGIRQTFLRWTALCLAIENQWGGENSKAKGEALMEEVMQWFYHKKGAQGMVCSNDSYAFAWHMAVVQWQSTSVVEAPLCGKNIPSFHCHFFVWLHSGHAGVRLPAMILHSPHWPWGWRGKPMAVHDQDIRPSEPCRCGLPRGCVRLLVCMCSSSSCMMHSAPMSSQAAVAVSRSRRTATEQFCSNTAENSGGVVM